MRRCRDGYLTQEHDGFWVDLQWLLPELKDLWKYENNPSSDAAFFWRFDIDIKEALDRWYDREAYLARYARQSWDDIGSTPVQILNRRVEALSRIVEGESPTETQSG